MLSLLFMNYKKIIPHEKPSTKLYQAYTDMFHRCNNPKHKAYDRYGGRGISLCKKWLNRKSFYADMGEPPPGHSLEKINNDKGYSKRNCSWATKLEQSNNKINNRFISFGGQTMTIAQWTRELGFNRNVILMRLRSGRTIKDALTLPLRGDIRRNR